MCYFVLQDSLFASIFINRIHGISSFGPYVIFDGMAFSI